MESNTEEKKTWINVQNQYKNETKMVTATTFTIKKVWRAITKIGTIEKSSIYIAIKVSENLPFNYFVFWGHQ